MKTFKKVDKKYLGIMSKILLILLALILVSNLFEERANEETIREYIRNQSIDKSELNEEQGN